MLGSSVCANRGNSGIEPDSEQRLKFSNDTSLNKVGYQRFNMLCVH